MDALGAGDARRRHPLARGIEVLTAMVDSDQDLHGVRELATRLDVSPSTVHRLLADLESLGLVSRTPSGSYRLGLEFLRLAWSATDRLPLHEASVEALHALTGRSGESAFFGVYSERRRQMMFTLTVESPHPLRYTLPTHEWLPLHAGASGLAILAFVPEEVRAAVLDGPLPPSTDRTPTDAPHLRARLDAIRAEGVAVTHGERVTGGVAIAAPVFGAFGEVVGASGVTLPEARFDDGDRTALESAVRDAAARISEHMVGSAKRASTG